MNKRMRVMREAYPSLLPHPHQLQLPHTLCVRHLWLLREWLVEEPGHSGPMRRLCLAHCQADSDHGVHQLCLHACGPYRQRLPSFQVNRRQLV